MEGEVIYIVYSYSFGLYSVLLTSITAKHNHRCHQKDSFCLFITFKSICLKSVHSEPKYKAIILHYQCDVLGLYFVSSRMWRLSTYFEDRRMLEYDGINYSQDYLDQVESQMDSNNIYYSKFQTWNLALQPAQNRSKLTIQLL